MHASFKSDSSTKTIRTGPPLKYVLTLLLAAIVANCKQLILRLDTTEFLIYTRGKSTKGGKTASGLKPLVGAKQPGVKHLGAK